MRSEARGYFLKEYGSWSVLIIAYLIGIGVSRAFAWSLLPLFFALALLINSKQAFMKWTRKTDDRKAFLILLAQIIGAAALFAAIFRSDVPRLLPLLVIPAAYLLSNKLAGEHYLVTELLGFALISLAAVLAKFLLTEGLDIRLFVGVALYFMANVFKVRVLLLRKAKERIFTVLFVFFTLYAYRRFYIPVIVLLPLLDNLMVAAVPYKVKLKTIGWIEVTKSILFLALFISYY